MNEFKLRAEDGAWPRFGDYAVVEQKRHGVPNEMYYHKVVATLNSNSWVDVPVQSPAEETLHDTSERIAIVICCGVDESKTYRVRVADLHKVEVTVRPGEAMSGWISVKDSLPPIRKHVLACRIGKKRNYGPFFAMTCGNELRPWRYIDGDRCDISITHWHELPDLPTE